MTDNNDKWGPCVVYFGGGKPEGIPDYARVRYMKWGDAIWKNSNACHIGWYGGAGGLPILVYRVRKESEKVVAYTIFEGKSFAATQTQYPTDTHKLTWNKNDEDKDTFTITVERL